MTSPVSICNQALLWLGQNTITSLEDQNTTAEWCLNNYEPLRDAVLEERMWSFALERVESTATVRDEWDSSYVHPIPQEWANVWRVYQSPPAGPRFQGRLDSTWRREGGNILSYYSTVYMWGQLRDVDESKFSPMFTQALAARIAADAAIPFTENATLQRDMWTLYGSKLSQAAVRDGQQGANDKIVPTNLVGVRYSGGIGD